MKKFLICVIVLFGLTMFAVTLTSDSSTKTVTTTTSADPIVDKQPIGITMGQKQALRAAQTYVGISGFSKQGLMEQLTSDAGEGFSEADATYAVKHVKVDWNAEAVESARSYLQMSSFSRAGLIRQLTSNAGEGFTVKQATYAVNKVGL